MDDRAVGHRSHPVIFPESVLIILTHPQWRILLPNKNGLIIDINKYLEGLESQTLPLVNSSIHSPKYFPLQIRDAVGHFPNCKSEELDANQGVGFQTRWLTFDN